MNKKEKNMCFNNSILPLREGEKYKNIKVFLYKIFIKVYTLYTSYMNFISLDVFTTVVFKHSNLCSVKEKTKKESKNIF